MVTNNEYLKIKNSVLDLYNNEYLPLIQAVKDGKETTYDDLLGSLKTQAVDIKKDKFRLMVAGEAKSGKSTFINAYIGEEILPMDVMQCTSSIITIRCGKSFTLKATYADGKTESINSAKKIREFLNKHAAINDNYRCIPVAMIDHEILIKGKGKKPPEKIIRDFLEGVKGDNVNRLPQDEYNNRIREYIDTHTKTWDRIIKKIEIEYPFEEEYLSGIEIVDSPGVNAIGKLGDITNEYIKNAHAIMFLKPLSGQALEDEAFVKFMDSVSVARNKNAKFLILTHAADVTPNEKEKLVKNAHDQYNSSVSSEQIIAIDSKAEIFYNKYSKYTLEECAKEINELDECGNLDKTLESAWFRNQNDRKAFLEKLKSVSQFDLIDRALERFARKAHFLNMQKFLEIMLRSVGVALSHAEQNINLTKIASEDLEKLRKQINKLNNEMLKLNISINETLDNIKGEYTGVDGKIETRADAVVNDLKNKIKSINPNAIDSVDTLEKMSFEKIDELRNFTKNLYGEVIKKCDDTLINAAKKTSLRVNAFIPNLTQEIIEKKREEIKKESAEIKNNSYVEVSEPGICFDKKVHKFSQSKYFKLFREYIEKELEKIKNDQIRNLYDIIDDTVEIYYNQLKENRKINEKNLSQLQRKLKEENARNELLKKFENEKNNLKGLEAKCQEIKKGVDKKCG